MDNALNIEETQSRGVDMVSGPVDSYDYSCGFIGEVSCLYLLL